MDAILSSKGIFKASAAALGLGVYAYAKGVTNLGSNPLHSAFLRSYLADFSGPFFWYGMLRSLDVPRMRAAAWPLMMCSAWEVGQRFHVIPGTYDPGDFLAYAAGVGAAFVVEEAGSRIIDHFSSKKKTTLKTIAVSSKPLENILD